MPRAARYELHGGIKLDTMENPYTWPDEMRRAWAERMHRVDVNRYPDASATAARNALRTAFGVPADLDIVVGNGSDELIQLAVMATGGPGRPVMSPA
nr:histidinol-phosphate aminotransferase [Actinomycetota bacterium]